MVFLSCHLSEFFLKSAVLNKKATKLNFSNRQFSTMTSANSCLFPYINLVSLSTSASLRLCSSQVGPEGIQEICYAVEGYFDVLVLIHLSS